MPNLTARIYLTNDDSSALGIVREQSGKLTLQVVERSDTSPAQRFSLFHLPNTGSPAAFAISFVSSDTTHFLALDLGSKPRAVLIKDAFSAQTNFYWYPGLGLSTLENTHYCLESAGKDRELAVNEWNGRDSQRWTLETIL